MRLLPRPRKQLHEIVLTSIPGKKDEAMRDLPLEHRRVEDRVDLRSRVLQHRHQATQSLEIGGQGEDATARHRRTFVRDNSGLSRSIKELARSPPVRGPSCRAAGKR